MKAGLGFTTDADDMLGFSRLHEPFQNILTLKHSHFLQSNDDMLKNRKSFKQVDAFSWETC